MEQQPQFLRSFSKEESRPERDRLAQEIREKRRAYFDAKNTIETKEEEKSELLKEIEALRDQVESYNNESFLVKVKDYFAIKKVEAQLQEKFGQQSSLEDELSKTVTGRPDLDETRQMISDFYVSEKKKWAEMPYSKEDIAENFTEEHLASLSLEDYATLLRRFPGEMVTHVTRQGIRDHADSIWHSSKMHEYATGFTDILKDKRLHSGFSITLQEYAKDEAMEKFLKLDTCNSREEASQMLQARFDRSASHDNQFADYAAVHFAAEEVADSMYGSERENEIFIAYPSAYIASQLSHSGDLADGSGGWHNDKWVYPKEHDGMSIDTALTFIPEGAQVDANTGSRYELDEAKNPIENKALIDSIENVVNSPWFASIATQAREVLGGLTGEWNDTYPKASDARTQIDSLRNQLAEKFNITDIKEQRAILDYNFLQDARPDKDELDLLIKKSLGRQGALLVEAKNTVSSREYWEQYFSKHPEQKPSKIVFYQGDDPTKALFAWRKKMGIIKHATEPNLGFSENQVAKDSDEANVDKDRFKSIAMRIIDERFPEETLVAEAAPEPISDTL